MVLKDKNITVVGLGISGRAALNFLYDKGARLKVTDKSDNPQIRESVKELKDKGIECEIGRHTEEFLNGTELLIVSPGVDNSSLPIKYAEEKRIPILSEIELAYRFCQGTIIAVSGTNGKSTVVSLIGEMFKKKDRRVYICGNIGLPFTSIVKDVDRDGVVVLEISSFQLERSVEFRPHIAVMLNITEDHLDRYRDFDEYVDAKLRLFMNQKDTDYAIINYEEAKFKKLKNTIRSALLYFSKHRLSKEYNGAYIENDKLVIRKDGKYVWIGDRDSLSLSGEHNLENALAAGLASFILGIDGGIIKDVLYNFKPLSHRYEVVDIIDGVRFIDDSKATNVDSVRRAIQSSVKGIILIAGGRDKGGDYSVLARPLKEKAKRIFLIGEAKEKIAHALSDAVSISFAATLEEAVIESHRIAKRGDTVLLSPMCSSFDMFKDYKERGEVFRRAVEGLKENA